MKGIFHGICEDEVAPLTNGDKIRGMTDEELATLISEIADECEKNTECHQHCYGCDIEYCVYESCLQWLQQPSFCSYGEQRTVIKYEIQKLDTQRP